MSERRAATLRHKAPGATKRSPHQRRKHASARVPAGDSATPAPRPEDAPLPHESGIPHLTRQEHFCSLVATGVPIGQAYRTAFQWDGDPGRCQRAAESLLAVPEIGERIALLMEPVVPVADDDALTLGEHLLELAKLERMAVALGQMGPAVQAAIHRGKASGLYIEKSVSVKVTWEELVAQSRHAASTNRQIPAGVTDLPPTGLHTLAAALDAVPPLTPLESRADRRD